MGTQFSVLALDDDESCLRLIDDALFDEYDLVTAGSLRLAVHLLHTRRFDLVIVDPDVPAETRADVIDALRAQPGFDATPILVCSDPINLRRLAGRHVQGFLAKPFSGDELRQAVARTLATGGGGGTHPLFGRWL